MAGFKAKKNLFKLIFEDPDMAGLEVVVTSVPMGKLLRIQELNEDDELRRSSKAFRELVGILAGAMLSWNLEDDLDEPVPVTAEGILTQDPAFVRQIISSWIDAISGVSTPLDGGSTTGDTSLEASMPMDALSPNPPS